jgi:HD-GYP domain-containing protein (c-di-GMP phosphodiesterase class II)
MQVRMDRESADISIRLGNRLILWMSLLISLQFFVELARWAVNQTNYSVVSVLSFGVCVLIHWVFYLLHRSSLFQYMFSEHVTAFCCFSLFIFVAVYNPLDYSQVSLVFLLYPIIISLLNNKKVFFLWSSLSYGVYSFFSFFSLLSSAAALPAGGTANWLVSQAFDILGSFAASLVILTHISTIKNGYLEKNKEKKKAHIVNMLHALVPIVERKSQRTSKEIEQMSLLMKRIMKQFPEEDVQDWEIQLISLVHYVSRIKWPDYVFEKQEKLTNYEYKVVQEHCFIGQELLMGYPSLERVIEAIVCHHERFDGSGYPHQLKGSAIPHLAQILGIAESFVAMTTPRVYRNALTPEEALMELRSMAGTAYDKRMVDALEKAVQLQSHAWVREKTAHLVG